MVVLIIYWAFAVILPTLVAVRLRPKDLSRLYYSLAYLQEPDLANSFVFHWYLIGTYVSIFEFHLGVFLTISNRY